MNKDEKKFGDCETCLYFDKEDQACWRYLRETHSYDSCDDWKDRNEGD